MRALLFKRTRKSRKHKRTTSQTSVVLKRPQDFLDGDMEQRPTTQPGKHRGPSAPLAGQVIGVRPVTDQPTRVLRAVSDETSMMPAATALPPSVAMTAQPNLRDVQARVVAALSGSSRPAYSLPPNAPFFRPEPDTAASDLSLATFHRDWYARMAPSVQLNPKASPKTVVMTAIGHADFPGSGVAR